MTNSYYNATELAAKHTLARAEAVNNLAVAVEAGFAKLPTEEEMKKGAISAAADTGSANVYVLALPYTITSYEMFQQVIFKAATSNTGASTLNVDGIGATVIKRVDGNDLVANDIVVNGVIEVRYNGTNWVLMSQTYGEETSAALSAAAASNSADAAAASAVTAASEADAAAASAAALGSLTKSDVGLGNVDNTSDANKPISSATATALSGKAATSHAHIIGNVTGLQTALDGKALASHTHIIGDVTGLQDALDGKAASSHAHSIANVTGLQAALDAVEQGGSLKKLATQTATGLETELDFTIPSWAKRVTVTISALKTNGTNNTIVQLGDSGGIEATGYVGSVLRSFGTNVGNAAITDGFRFGSAEVAAAVLHGSMTLTLHTGTTWVGSGVTSRSDAALFISTNGTKALSAALTTVRITTSSGSAVFTAGSVSVIYE